jgi:hypothetical protein
LYTDAGKPVTGGKTGTDPSGKRVVTFTNLKSGKYTPKGGIAMMKENPKEVIRLIDTQSLS